LETAAVDMLLVKTSNSSCYAVSLRGQHNGRYQPTFERFMLVVEPKDRSSSENSVTGDQNVGSFTLVGNNIAKYSNQCPNAIIQMSSLKKTEVKVTWAAPPPGSGCVVFRYKNHLL
jgi:hypothetical protein